jgi:hypothetical protein
MIDKEPRFTVTRLTGPWATMIDVRGTDERRGVRPAG